MQHPFTVCVFDFNDGCRMTLPEGERHVVLRDYETGIMLFETDIGAGAIASGKKYFVPFELRVEKRGKDADAAFIHRCDANGREGLDPVRSVI